MVTSVCLEAGGVNVGVTNYTVFSLLIAGEHRLCGLLFRARGGEEIMSARLGPTQGPALLSQTGIKPSGQRRSNSPHSRVWGVLGIPPLECNRLCLNNLNQIYVSDR